MFTCSICFYNKLLKIQQTKQSLFFRLKQQLSREGLGLKSSSSNMYELKAKCRIAFKEFVMGDMQNDIVFSTDFTNDERAMIHQYVSLTLKSLTIKKINCLPCLEILIHIHTHVCII